MLNIFTKPLIFVVFFKYECIWKSLNHFFNVKHWNLKNGKFFFKLTFCINFEISFIQLCCCWFNIIVRIEFSAMVQTNDNIGHYGPLETTGNTQLKVTTWYLISICSAGKTKHNPITTPLWPIIYTSAQLHESLTNKTLPNQDFNSGPLEKNLTSACSTI